MQRGAGRLQRRVTMPGRNPDPRGYYALLHVSPEASRQEIGRAFRALMRRRHPDVGHSGAGVADAVPTPVSPRRRRRARDSGRFHGAARPQGAGGLRRRRRPDGRPARHSPNRHRACRCGRPRHPGAHHPASGSARARAPRALGTRTLAGEPPARRPLTRTEAALTCPFTSPTPRGGDRP